MDAFIGTVIWVAFKYAPVGWMICDGASLPVSQYAALYALIGNTYGGNNTTFNLPNLIGRTIFGPTTAAPNFLQGNVGGQIETPALLPAHTHVANVGYTSPVATGSLSAQVGVPVASLVASPQQGYTLANTADSSAGATPQIYAPQNAGTGSVTMSGVSVGLQGGSVSVAIQPAGTPVKAIPTLPPYLVLLPIICVEGGIYPPHP